MDRPQVFELLAGERKYQDDIKGNMNHKGVPTIEAEILMMEQYLLDARTKWVNSHGNTQPASMRKVAGMAVRCFENHGCPPRKQLN